MKKIWKHFERKKLLYVVGLTIVLGIMLRFYAMSKGHNFDFDSYKIVGDIVNNGGNVYDETKRYNYGPVWLIILGIFKSIAAFFSNPDVFRILIVSLLTATDLAIAFILRKKYGIWAFVLFFLNPISIVITGYHNQFDNLAVLIGMLGLLMMPDDKEKSIKRGHVYSALIIGLSLMTKHLFFILPIWLFIRGKSLRVKLFMLFVPILIFIVGFVPFWAVGHEGIIQNVFMYKSMSNAPLLHAITSPTAISLFNTTLLLGLILVVVGFMTRKLKIIEASFWYLIVLVVFSPAIANQYLAIAMPAIVGLGFVFFIPFIILASLLLIGISPHGLHIQKIANTIPDYLLPLISASPRKGGYDAIIVTLFVGMILSAIYKYRRHWYRSLYLRIKVVVDEQLKMLRS